MSPTQKRLGVVAAAILVLVGLGWIVSSAEITAGPVSPPEGAETEPSTAPSGSPTSLPAAPETGGGDAGGPEAGANGGIAGVVLAVLLGLCVLVLASVLITLAVRAVRRNTGWARLGPHYASETVAAEEIRSAIQAGLSDIDDGGDPRAAVIACWLRLEHAAAAVGVARAESETPSELVARVLAAHRIGDDALDALRNAYHRARYAPDAVDARLRDAARAALAEVDSRLAAEVPHAET